MNLLTFASAYILTGLSLIALKPAAIKLGLVDIPGGRKTHISATPLVGGLGIFIGIACITFAMPNVSAEFGPLLSLSAIILFIGTIDDATELTPLSRMLGHSLVALAMAVVAGVELGSLGALITERTIDLGALTIPITVFATVGVINAINMSDGIDGLSGSLVVVTLAYVSILSFSSGQVLAGSFCLIMICSITAFLSLNFRRPWDKKALIYLGDAGSTMLGFILAWLLITSTQGMTPVFAPVYALWFLAVPLIDTVNLLIKRPLRGKSSFAPDNDHLHHMLLSRGYSVGRVVLIILSIAIVCGGIGLLGLSMGAKESTMFILFVTLFSLYFCLGDRIRAQPTS